MLGTKVEYFEVDYSEFEQFVRQEYDVELEFACNQESSNDVSYTFSVDNKPLNNYDENKLSKFKAGEDPQFISHILLNDLCNRGVIEPGKYLIKVSW